MLVFISWSGDRSRFIASALADWLPHVIQSVRTFFSPDIEKGTVGLDVIAKNLKEASAGIICLTRENLNSSWVNFEAGALSKFREDSRVWTLLFDVDHRAVQGPLSQFQHTLATKDELFKLVKSINANTSGGVDPDRLRSAFDSRWPSLNKRLEEAMKMEITLENSDRQLIEETLREIRATNANIQNIDETRIFRQLGLKSSSYATPDDVKRRYGG